MNFLDRPSFAEGQVLSASELELVVDYARSELEQHDHYGHTWGVLDGLRLQTQPAGAGPGTSVAIVVTPGFAIDQRYRQIEVTTQMTLPPDNIAGLSSGPYPAYVWSTDDSLVPNRTMDPCQTVVERVRETVHVGVFPDVATALAANPSAVCLGNVAWDFTRKSFVPSTDTDPSHDTRQRGGVRANELVAPEHRVVVHSEDAAATTFTVKGTVQAIGSDDKTLPIIQAPGGAVNFSPAIPVDSAAPPATKTMSLSYIPKATTGNALVLDLGNADPNSQFLIEKHGNAGPGTGTQIASISAKGNGTIEVANGDFTAVNASANVTVSGSTSSLSIEAVPPFSAIGISASDSLALAYGAAPTDVAVFVAGANPTATIDAHTITLNEKHVAVGTIDTAAGAAGIKTTMGDRLVLGTNNNDVDIAPGMATLLRFTLDHKVLNMSQSACDVTPITDVSGASPLFRLGPIAIAFGTATLTLRPISDAPPTIMFPKAFTSAPAFFVSAYATGKFSISASPTSVSTTQATYKVVRLNPLSPSDGDAATYSDTSTKVSVSWVAFGEMP